MNLSCLKSVDTLLKEADLLKIFCVPSEKKSILKEKNLLTRVNLLKPSFKFTCIFTVGWGGGGVEWQGGWGMGERKY